MFGFTADDYFAYMLFKEYLGWIVVALLVAFLLVCMVVSYIRELRKERRRKQWQKRFSGHKRE